MKCRNWFVTEMVSAVRVSFNDRNLPRTLRIISAALLTHMHCKETLLFLTWMWFSVDCKLVFNMNDTDRLWSQSSLFYSYTHAPTLLLRILVNDEDVDLVKWIMASVIIYLSICFLAAFFIRIAICQT